MYDTGQGVPQDYQEAERWYRLAAEQGHAKAQYNLGVMYTNGKGVPQDYVQAHTWINLAASRATTGEAKYRLARDSLAERMTASQVAEAQRLAREWQPKTWEQLTGK
jgi:TPR repeat protein